MGFDFEKKGEGREKYFDIKKFLKAKKEEQKKLTRGDEMKPRREIPLRHDRSNGIGVRFSEIFERT